MVISTLIAKALSLAAKEAVKSSAGIAVKESYNGVKSLLSKRFGGKVALEAIERNPESEENKKQLEESLKSVGADKDSEFLEVIKSLIEVLKQNVPSVEINGLNIETLGGAIGNLTTGDNVSGQSNVVTKYGDTITSQNLSQIALKAMESLALKDARIIELEAKAQLTYEERKQLELLLTEVPSLRKSLQESDEIKVQLEKDKQELEKHFKGDKDKSELKKKALEEIELGDYDKAEVHLKEAAENHIKEASDTYFQIGNIKKMQLNYLGCLTKTLSTLSFTK